MLDLRFFKKYVRIINKKTGEKHIVASVKDCKNEFEQNLYFKVLQFACSITMGKFTAELL